MNASSAFEKPFLSFPEMETDRLVLREIIPDDVYSYYKHHSTIYESPFWEGAPETLSETKDLFREIKLRYINRESLYWGISLKQENPIVGSCFFPELEFETNATLGFWLSKEYQQQGLMTEALSHIVDYAFSQMKLKIIIAGCYSANQASHNVLMNCNFTHASHSESKPHRRAYGWSSDVMVCLLRQK